MFVVGLILRHRMMTDDDDLLSDAETVDNESITQADIDWLNERLDALDERRDAMEERMAALLVFF